MTTDVMTSQAKGKLAKAIRALRSELVRDFSESVERSYRLSIPAEKAKLNQELSRKRARLEAWIGERQRAGAAKAERDGALSSQTRAQLIAEIVQEAGYTLLNRLVYLRILESTGLRADHVLSKGWSSRGYQDFRELAPALSRVQGDETEGYAFLLRLVFDELATELPGLFGEVGLTSLVPVPPSTLRNVIEVLNDEALDSCWVDDTCLGWIYQYWNDPQREALDEKVKNRGKIEPWEVASKTQMFTDRYMAQWLLQNTLGQLWFAICEKNGWEPEVKQNGLLTQLEEQRASWRQKRTANEVSQDALMPISTQAQHWKYWVPQPLPTQSAHQAPESLRDVKLLDPACGSGHFLVLATDLLLPLYREESRHRNQDWSDEQILGWILQDNLHGIDIDARAIQITAAALFVKARRLLSTPGTSAGLVQTMNLVAPTLHLSSLTNDDPSICALKAAIHQDTGIAPELTQKLIDALRGAKYLGTLLRIDAAITQMVQAHGQQLQAINVQHDPDAQAQCPEASPEISEAQNIERVAKHLDRFLASHSKSEDLGLRLAGVQLATGVRFTRMLQERSYDVVIANPPYHGLGKLAQSDYIETHYSQSKSDLYTVFMERGFQLCKEGGLCAMVTLSNWMFLKTSAKTRSRVESLDLRILADFGKASFANGSRLISASAFVVRNSQASNHAVAIRPTAPQAVRADDDQWKRTRAGLLCQQERYEFDPKAFAVIPESPVVYWWSKQELQAYEASEPLLSLGEIRAGGQTGNNARFLRYWFELQPHQIFKKRPPATPSADIAWVPYIKGASGIAWFQPLKEVVYWPNKGMLLELAPGSNTAANRFFYRGGVAFTSTGNVFRARIHYYSSAIDIKGQSQLSSDCALSCASMNSKRTQKIIGDLNPTVSFQPGDAKRLPLVPVESTRSIFDRLELAFEKEEQRRETSIDFKSPGPSYWVSAQAWAQRAIDRPPGEPLPVYEETQEGKDESQHEALSFALGVALGRFGEKGQGVLDPSKDQALIASALPAGLLFLDASLPEEAQSGHDRSLDHPAATLLRQAWDQGQLSTFLRTKFFGEVHKKMYDNRPIHWPLSSAKKTYVAWVNIHRMDKNTLRTLLADHLVPAASRQENELKGLRESKASSSKKEQRSADQRYAILDKQHQELQEFIAQVTQCAEKGPPSPQGRQSYAREVDAVYDPCLDDGVMINAAALWPLLEAQWKDPKKWWKELASGQGRKDYDWAKLAKRYFPTRVEKKCQKDASLAVTHGRFWKYHPEMAYAWELRLQAELGPDFRIDEADSNELRQAFLEHKRTSAQTIQAKEQMRREKKQAS